MMGPQMMGPELGMGLGVVMMLINAVLWSIFIIAAVWLVVRLVRSWPARDASSEKPTAIRVLEERLARGEIDVDEFRSRRAAMADRTI